MSTTKCDMHPKSQTLLEVHIFNEQKRTNTKKDSPELSELERSKFYCYLKSKDIDKYQEVKDDIPYIFNNNKGRYGCRRILTVLKQKGYTINHKTVLKLMNELNIKGKQHKNGKYHSYKGEIVSYSISLSPNLYQVPKSETLV